MKILVTGVAGFIGSRIAEAMLGHGHQVAGVDDLSTGRHENVAREVDFIEGDIRNGIPQDRWDVIYHCAASYRDRSDWERDSSVNVGGTIRVVREAQRCGAKVVYCQTSLCYGPSPASPVEVWAPLDPRGSYAVSKTAAEAYIRDSGVDFVSLRLANVYGPRNLSGPVPAFWKALTEGRPCTVVDSRRDFVYVDDMVWVAVEAATRGSGVYHVSTGTDRTVLSLYRAIAQAMRIDPPEPPVQRRGADDVATLLLDPGRTREDFGWQARTPLASGIRSAVDWYAEHGVAQTYTHLAQTGAAR